MRHRMNLVTAALAAAVGAFGCAPSNGAPERPAPERSGPEVVVENHNWHDMTVYVVRGGLKHRLGMVTSMQERRFRLPSWVLASSGEVQLMADPIGSSQTYTSPLVMVDAGGRLDWNLENHLALSSLSVF